MRARRRRFRAYLGSVVYVLLAMAAVRAEAAAPLKKLSANIPPQPVIDALAAFERDTGLACFFRKDVPADAAGRHSHGTHAGLAAERALEELLSGTGLTYEKLNESGFSIKPRSAPRAAVVESATDDATPTVTVTGTRWEWHVTQEPVAYTPWDSAAMEASGVKGIADVAALTPGADWGFYSSVGSGVYTDLVVRGVTDRHGSATGIFYDEIAIPAARSNTFGRALPPYFDLDRIEVLRGPQGATLGADSQGGAALFVPRQPSLTNFSAVTHAEWAMTERGDPSYELGAAAGGPISDGELGYRVSAWYRTDGGYVNLVNPFTCLPTCTTVDANANEVTTESFRAALTYMTPSAWSITPALTYTAARSRDSPAFFTYLSSPGDGRLDNGSLIPQPFDDRFTLASLKVKGNIREVELDSLTAYYRRLGDLAVDDTESSKWGGWNNPQYPGQPAYPASYRDAVITTAALRQSLFSQELRLLSPVTDHSLTWMAGAYYSRTSDTEAYRVTGQHIPILDDQPLDASNSTTTEQTQLGAFGEVHQRLLAQLTLAAGVRVEWQQYDSHAGPPLFHATWSETLVAPTASLFYEAGGALYNLTVSRGYSPAGVDAALPTCFENPSPYPADTLWSYEVGAKLKLHDGLDYLHAAVFDARWNNGPVATGNCLVTHVPGGAYSRGVELDAQLWLPWDLRSSLSFAYIDARYTDTVAADGQVIVNDGDALGTPPLVASPWNVVGSLERTFWLRGTMSATVRADDAFHSHNGGPFYTGIPSPSPYYAPYIGGNPATNFLNLRATVSLLAFGHSADVALFLNNAFDSQPTLLKRNKGVDISTLYYATTFQPRTLGLAGTVRF